MYISEMILVS